MDSLPPLSSPFYYAVWTWIGFMGPIMIGMIVFSYFTQAGNIARATTKEAVRQPVFLLLMFLSSILLLLNTYVPFFTLGEDVKMLKDCGLMTILVASLLLAVWTSSTSIAGEIEGKTAMTLLSKPITRRQFVVGKYVGILQAVLILMVVLKALFLLLIYYKVGYDAKESSKDIPEMLFRLIEVVHILPGLVLLFLEVAVLTAISVAISTRLPMIVNIVSCFAIFVIGHLTAILVQSGVLKLEFVEFMARLIATVLPSLEAFNMQAAVATGRLVPAWYLLMATVYCAAYCGAAILTAFILFEDRDLA
ncbi:MAG: ABC transporter permease [Planctomycetota bacterium]|nr:ABC transporter permease [Planctomycetota bacterium]